MFGLSSLKMIFLMFFCLLGGLWETEAVPVTGRLGEEVTIKCSHSNAFSNVKYFCMGACKHDDVLISSRDKKKVSNGKYSISDEGNIFYVTISHLTEDDSGTYWCGVDRAGLDTHNKVVLTVTEGNIDDADKDFSDTPPSISNETTDTKASSKKLVYIGASLGVVVLALATVALIFFKHRRTHGNIPDTVYAAPLSQKQEAHHITASSSTANEDPEGDGRTKGILSLSFVQHRDTSRDHTDNIYCNVGASSESHIPADRLCYSTVCFDKHTDCSIITPHTAAVTHSTEYSNISADQSTLCRNV